VVVLFLASSLMHPPPFPPRLQPIHHPCRSPLDHEDRTLHVLRHSILLVQSCLVGEDPLARRSLPLDHNLHGVDSILCFVLIRSCLALVGAYDPPDCLKGSACRPLSMVVQTLGKVVADCHTRLVDHHIGHDSSTLEGHTGRSHYRVSRPLCY
jgi:hypothetical protein